MRKAAGARPVGAGETPRPALEQELFNALTHAAITVEAIYRWVDQIEQLGGATNMEGVARCHAMLTSLKRNRPRVQRLVLDPARAALLRAERSETK